MYSDSSLSWCEEIDTGDSMLDGFLSYFQLIDRRMYLNLNVKRLTENFGTLKDLAMHISTADNINSKPFSNKITEMGAV